MTTVTDFLLNKGLTLDQQQRKILSGSSNSTTRIIPLIHQQIFSIQGPDTHKFLQGQLTCDIDSVFTRGSSLGAHCNIKGHMLSLFRLMKTGEDQIWLRCNHDISESAIKNLQKYIVFSKAEITDLNETISGIGITGPGAAALIEKWFDHAPSEDNGILNVNQGIVVRVPGNRFEVWMEQNALIELLEQLPEEVCYGDSNDWVLSEIDAGIPDLRTATQEAFIPQMTNFQAVDGVSFTKGCYTGQEIVTRLQHRGVLKKPMYLAEITTQTPPVEGDTLSSENKPSAGQIVLAAKCDENRYRVLAVIVKSLAESQPVYLRDTQDSLKLLELPYELDPRMFEAKS